MSNKFVVILDDEDAALLAGLQRILGALKPAAGEDTAAEQTNPPTTARRRRAGADSASSTTGPASDAGASAGRRARRSAEPAPQPEPPAEEGPRRRRRTEEPKDDRITDADLTKAASQAGEVISPKVVMQIIKEDYGVETVNEIPQDKRRAFLDTLKFEMSGD